MTDKYLLPPNLYKHEEIHILEVADQPGREISVGAIDGLWEASLYVKRRQRPDKVLQQIKSLWTVDILAFLQHHAAKDLHTAFVMYCINNGVTPHVFDINEAMAEADKYMSVFGIKFNPYE